MGLAGNHGQDGRGLFGYMMAFSISMFICCYTAGLRILALELDAWQAGSEALLGVNSTLDLLDLLCH